ncbi:MAG: hypothetical protein JWN11_2356 [Hyphomicrobiales bacterium]|nr:hypothetical protein [Hyphomicrobiales bacterium]
MTESMAAKALFLSKAEKGEGAFAIAFALLELAEAQQDTATAIGRLGNGSASTPFGAIENLAMQVEKIASAISEAGSNVSEAIGDK